MTTPPSSPHDQFFKKALENPKVAREFFTAHLPVNIKSIVDLECLKMAKESFVDESLRRSVSDVLFTTSFAGKTGYLWLLVEHQSSVDHLMSFRLLRYMTNIWQRHLELHKNTRELPIIYPLILYNGQAKYTAPLSIWQLFAEPELARFCVSKFQLIDLSNIPDSEFAKHTWAGIFEYFMKHIKQRDFLKVLENSQDMMLKAYTQDKDDTISYLRMILYYNINKISKESQNSLKQVINTITTEQGEEVMASLAEVWQQEGIEKGIRQGIQQGIEQGVRQGIQQGMQQGIEQGIKQGIERSRREKLAAAAKLLELGIDVEQISNIIELSIEEIKKSIQQ